VSQNFLKCDLHDYLEIACLYKFEVELILKEDTKILGIPITIKTNEKTEYLDINSCGKLITVPVLSLKSMRACKENPHFCLVKFEQECS
jgi:Rho-binding antiterminator